MGKTHEDENNFTEQELSTFITHVKSKEYSQAMYLVINKALANKSEEIRKKWMLILISSFENGIILAEQSVYKSIANEFYKTIKNEADKGSFEDDPIKPADF